MLYVSSDNLGAHSFAGGQRSFNVDGFCWFSLTDWPVILTIKSCSVQSKTLFIENQGVL